MIPLKHDLVYDWYLADVELDEAAREIGGIEYAMDNIRKVHRFEDGSKSDRGFNYEIAKRVAKPLLRLFRVWLSHRAFGISTIDFWFLYKCITEIERIEANCE